MRCDPDAKRRNEEVCRSFDNERLITAMKVIQGVSTSQMPNFSANQRAYFCFVRREARNRGLL